MSSFYKGQLDDLMKTLYATDPSFIRCVVPNTHKIPGGVEPGLVMHQYQCNGVLAGIAICRKGFPNKVGTQRSSAQLVKAPLCYHGVEGSNPTLSC